MEYYITSSNPTTIGYWKKTKAQSLNRAKMLATKDKVYINDTAKVAIEYEGRYVVVATKPPGMGWIDY